MTDEAKLHKAQSRGDRAKALLDNDLLKDAFESLESDYSAALFETKPQDAVAREKLYLAVNVVRKVRDHLNSVIADGRLAQAELNRLASDTERKKKLGIF